MGDPFILYANIRLHLLCDFLEEYVRFKIIFIRCIFILLYIIYSRPFQYQECNFQTATLEVQGTYQAVHSR